MAPRLYGELEVRSENDSLILARANRVAGVKAKAVAE
jgi:hypothetical protein